MDRFKKVFRSKEGSHNQHGPARASPGSANGSSESWGSDYERISSTSSGADSGDADRPAEGFLCPVCMLSFNDVETLQSHFESAHTEAQPSPAPKAREETLSDELGLIKMQLTASEESRLLHLREFIELQRQADELKLEHAKTLAALAEERQSAVLLRREADSARSNSAALQQSLTSTSSTTQSLESQLRDEKAASVELGARVARLEVQLSDALTSSNQLTAALASARQAAAAAQQAQADLSGRLADNERHAADARLQADGVRAELLRLGEEAAARERQVRDELERARRSEAALEDRLSAAQERLDAEERARAALHKLETGEQAVEDTVAQLQEENVRLSAKLEATMRLCSQEKDELRAVLKDKERDLNSSFDSLLKTHEQSVADAARRLLEAEQRHAAEALRCQEELVAGKSREAELRSALADSTARLQEEEERAKELVGAAEAAKRSDEQSLHLLGEQLQTAETGRLSERARADALDSKLAAAEAALSERHSELERLQRTLDEERSRAALVERELAVSREDTASAKAQSSAATADLLQRLASAEQALADCKSDLAASQKKLSEGDEKAVQLERELTLSSRSHEEAHATLSALLENSQRDLEATKQEFLRERTGLQQEVLTYKELLAETEQAATINAAELQIKCSEKEQLCIQIGRELDSIRASKNSLKQELDSAQNDLTRCRSDLDSAAKEKAALTSSCARLSGELSEATERCERLELQAAELAAEKNSLKLALEQTTLENQELARTHAEAVEQLTRRASSERAASLAEQAQSLQAKFDALLNEHDEASQVRLQHECAEMERAKQRDLAAHAAAHADQLRAERMRAEEAEVRSNMQLASLNENLATVKTDLTATQEKLMDVVKHNDQLRGTLLELEAKLENNKEDRRVLLQRCLECEHENTRLKEELSSCRRRFDEKEAALQELSRENQMLQIKAARAQGRKWTDDREVTECSNCAKAFSVTVRKHHCRNCGNIFCNECSNHSAATPSSRKPVRVCDTCFRDLDGQAAGAIM